MAENKDPNRSIKAVVLAGSYDFGRCPLATSKPPALWRVFGATAMQRLLLNLQKAGVVEVTICAGEHNTPLLQQVIEEYEGMEVKFLDEELPEGTAGCVRNAAGEDRESMWLVTRAALICFPSIEGMIRTHCESDADMTVMLNPLNEGEGVPGQLADLYVLEPQVLDVIPRGGFFDIKEGLIPALAHDGLIVRTHTLPHTIGSFRNGLEYLEGVSNCLHNLGKCKSKLVETMEKPSEGVFISPHARVAKSARLYGPIVVMDSAVIGEDVTMMGPVLIEPNVKVERGAFLENTVVWQDARIGAESTIRSCVVDCDVHVKARREVAYQPLLSSRKTQWKKKWPGVALVMETFVFILALIGAFVWAFMPVLRDLFEELRTSEEYSAGLLVVPFAVYLAWCRRKEILSQKIRHCHWGALAFVVSLSLLMFGLFFGYASAERVGMVLTIFSVVLWAFGKGVFWRLLPVLLFLFLMVPFPRAVHNSLLVPAQDFAIRSACFFLELFGFLVIRDGNMIEIGSAQLIVGQGCNGLRMVTANLVIAGMIALLVKRAWWEKWFVFMSGFPIALFCNTLRIVFTATIYVLFDQRIDYEKLHDLGGYLMMPLSIVIVLFEFWILGKLVPEKEIRLP